MRVLVCATQGAGGDDEQRIRELVKPFDTIVFEFQKTSKLNSAIRLLKLLRSREFDLFVLEGTGFAGGIAAILGRILWGAPYVLSSGDAVGPFLAARHPIGKPAFYAYEKLLSAKASGFIGWTPYLVGRALTYGTPRATSIPGWAPFSLTRQDAETARREVRASIGIPQDAIVFGMIGSLNWSKRFQYCYGSELVRAARLAGSAVHVLVVGSGSGLDVLRSMAGDALDTTIHLPGRIARDQVPAYLAAMDIGSIPQTVNGVGSFRYTTKLPEYRAARVPFVTNQIPMSYDLDDGTLWRLPGDTPWDAAFLNALAELMKRITLEEVAARKANFADTDPFDFERPAQLQRAAEFFQDVCAAEKRKA